LGKLETVHAANVLQSALGDADSRVRQLVQKTLDRLDMLGIKPDLPAPKRALKLTSSHRKAHIVPSTAPKRAQKSPSLRRIGNPSPKALPELSPKLVAEPTLIWQKMLEAPDQKAFAKWFLQKKRSEKIRVLEEIENHPPRSVWSGYLKDLLEQEVDPFAISKVVKVLARHHGPGSDNWLEPYLEHKDERVVANAIEALAMSGGTSDFSRLLSFLDHSDPRVKATAARTLWEVQPMAALKAVSTMAQSGKLWERDAARHALSFCPLSEGKNLLKSLGKRQCPVTAEEPFLPKIQLPSGVSKLIPAGLPEGLLGFLEKIGFYALLVLRYPIHVGTDEPQPVWIMLSLVCMCLILFFFLFIPFFEWLIPGPPMWG